MGAQPTLQLSGFASLPYEVQEYIVALIDHKGTFVALSTACKYLSELCIRSMYQALDFQDSNAGGNCWANPRNTVRLNGCQSPQSLYTKTLKTKPEIAAFTRYLTWDISNDFWSWSQNMSLPICQIWTALEQLAAVRTLNLRVNVTSSAIRPPVPLFPRLVRARIQGTFPQNTLAQILFTSPNIRHLTITPSAREYLHHPDESYAYDTSIEPFLRASVCRQAFRGLRTLDLGLEERIDPELAIQFIEISAEWIEELRLNYSFGEPLTAYDNWVIPMLQTGRWKQLRRLELCKCAIPKNDVFNDIAPH
ncbi:hypothetical protein FRC12_008124 [Ceratobasidium sp. 428]|nr:hypothetical protein FRC12_008124 [Ceratobasidium sp. 428]